MMASDYQHESSAQPWRKVTDIDWGQWLPQQKATLLFVIKNGCILLIFKKRGLGAGKISAPGGRLEPGETPIMAAIREVNEEIGIDVLDASYNGELYFQFVDGFSLHVTVFRASDFRGEPRESDEADPRWYSLEAIPYDSMWEDDAYWIPLMLKHQSFQGRFLFDNDRMLDYIFDPPGS